MKYEQVGLAQPKVCTLIFSFLLIFEPDCHETPKISIESKSKPIEKH